MLVVSICVLFIRIVSADGDGLSGFETCIHTNALRYVERDPSTSSVDVSARIALGRSLVR